MLRSFLPLAAAAVLAGCANSTPLPAATTPVLAGQWQLQSAPGLPAAPAGVSLVLREAPTREGRTVLEAGGYSGVNHFRGQATVNAAGQQLVFGPLAATRMGGPEERMRFEGAYLQQLEKVGRYRFGDSGTLVLETLSGETMTFARQPR